MERSACATTVVATLAVLLAPFGSFAFETVALFETLPPFGGAVIENVRVGKLAALAIAALDVQVMVPPETAPQSQPVPDPLAPVAPAGSVSTTVVVPVLGSGPPLLIVTM